MRKVEIKDGNVKIFTFREGFFARFGHDLQMSVERFRVEVLSTSIDAFFDAGSLRVEGAIIGGKMDQKEPSERDKRRIESTVRNEILRSAHHPEIRFHAPVTVDKTAAEQLEKFDLRGSLSLLGHSDSVCLSLVHSQKRILGCTSIQPSKWGITPYQAFFGTLRLQDRVDVSIEFADTQVLSFFGCE